MKRRKAKRQIKEAMIKYRSMTNERSDRVLGWASVFHGGYKSLRG